VNKDLMFSSANENWETPQAFFDEQNDRYHFTLDVCASIENAKVHRFYTKATDALSVPWAGRCWMNPPYKDPEQPCKKNCTKKKCEKRGFCIDTYAPGTIDWVKKAYDSVFVDRTAELVCCLLPARTDTKWFHRYVWDHGLDKPKPGVRVRFYPSRLKFLEDGAERDSAPFPSLLVVFSHMPIL
jgi:site-specific DNA-methyltransferase (adenine-specific)